MARAEQQEIAMRIVIERPVPGVLYSLQDKDGGAACATVAVTRRLLV